MSDVGNMLAQFGNRPSLLTDVANLRGQQIQNRLGEAQTSKLLNDMDQSNRLRDAYSRYAGGDQGALQEIAGIDPETHQKMQAKAMAMDKAQREEMQARVAEFGQVAISAKQAGPQAWAQAFPEIPFEQADMAIMRATASKDVFDALQAQEVARNKPPSFTDFDVGDTTTKTRWEPGAPDVGFGAGMVPVTTAPRYKPAGTSVTNIMPGSEKLIDVPKFQKDVQSTIDPQLKMVNTADNAITLVDDALETGNPASFNAARQQLIAAIGDGNTNAAELAQAGIDPVAWGIIDNAVKVATGTPTKDTMQQMRAAALLLRNKAAATGNSTLDKQKRIAASARQSGSDVPIYDPGFLDTAFGEMQFKPRMKTVKLSSGKTVQIPE